MNLYQIDKAILDCCDPETGEILDIEALEALTIQRAEKIEGVACWIKNLTAEADAIKAEKDNLAEREARCRKKAEDLKLWMAAALNGQKFSSAKCAVSFRKSEKVNIQDESLVPNQFLNITYTYKPDRQAIRQAIKAGQEVSGCSLVECLNAQIK